MNAASDPSITVVIPCFRRPDLIRSAVLSLFNQDLEKDRYEIIVVDSTPGDEVVEALKHLPPSPCSFRWFTKKPEGPGPSRNLGARNARGRFIAFMDHDCQASPGWLREMADAFGALTGGVGIVQGQTLPDPAGRMGIFTHTMVISSEGFLYETCNIGYRREAFEQAGGFHGADLNPMSSTPMGGEDADLAWRVKRNGWKTRFAPEALVHHAILPVSPWRWLFIKRMFIFPKLMRDLPECREFMFARYFFDKAQACLFLALVGLALAFATPWCLLLVAPYVVLRATEPTQSLKGILRLARAGVYFVRDTLSFFLLLAGSVRFGAILL